MTKVEQTVAKQADKCEAEARDYLLEAATDTVFYVALGKCLMRELAEKYGLTEEHARK